MNEVMIARIVEVAPEFRVARGEDWKTGDLVVQVALNGQKHERRLQPLNDADYQDLKIAGGFAQRAQQAADMGYLDAWLTEWCLAVERLFPDLREELPA